MKNSKIAIVGCGYWGKNFVRNFSELGVLYCICEPNEKIAKNFKDIKNLSFKEVLLDKNIDGVILAVPAKHHFEMARRVMEANKHVFVEKPLALKKDEAITLIQISKSQNKHLMVGHLLQYHPAFIRLKKLCKDGAIGKIKHINSNRMSLGKIRTEEDVIWSFAPHDISMILSLINKTPVESVYASGNSIFQDKISDIANIDINFEDNIKARVSVSWLNPFKEHKLVVTGEEGMIVFDDTRDWNEKIKLFNIQIDNSIEGFKIIKKERYITVNEMEPLKEECIHFLKLINNEAENITDGNEGLRVLEILTAASDSLSEDCIINV